MKTDFHPKINLLFYVKSGTKWPAKGSIMALKKNQSVREMEHRTGKRFYPYQMIIRNYVDDRRLKDDEFRKHVINSAQDRAIEELGDITVIPIDPIENIEWTAIADGPLIYALVRVWYCENEECDQTQGEAGLDDSDEEPPFIAR
jgi:hypothetical protein